MWRRFPLHLFSGLAVVSAGLGKSLVGRGTKQRGPEKPTLLDLCCFVAVPPC
jgi:hypothetical protein